MDGVRCTSGSVCAQLVQRQRWQHVVLGVPRRVDHAHDRRRVARLVHVPAGLHRRGRLGVHQYVGGVSAGVVRRRRVGVPDLTRVRARTRATVTVLMHPVCSASTFKSVNGNAACTNCPTNSFSPAGAAQCTCVAGYAGATASQCSGAFTSGPPGASTGPRAWKTHLGPQRTRV